MTNSFQHLVIAENDPDDLLLLVDALNEVSPGIELKKILAGGELISALEEVEKPDAIFIDLYLPGKNGKQCLKEIRERHEFNNVQIIMLGGSHLQADVDYCLTNGANYFFTKPSSYKELVNIVDSICRQVRTS